MPRLSRRRLTVERNEFYINRAICIIKDADKLLQATKRCLEESRAFPLYLRDLQELVDNLMYLNVANNASYNELNPPRGFVKKKTRSKRK